MSSVRVVEIYYEDEGSSVLAVTSSMEKAIEVIKDDFEDKGWLELTEPKPDEFSDLFQDRFIANVITSNTKAIAYQYIITRWDIY